jgi:hypothetical protein
MYRLAFRKKYYAKITTLVLGHLDSPPDSNVNLNCFANRGLDGAFNPLVPNPRPVGTRLNGLEIPRGFHAATVTEGWLRS